VTKDEIDEALALLGQGVVKAKEKLGELARTN